MRLKKSSKMQERLDSDDFDPVDDAKRSSMIYLDNAATTLWKPACVQEAVIKAMSSAGNPGRGIYQAAEDAEKILLQARERVSRYFHAEGAERTAFTQNATEALNTALWGTLREGDHVITTAAEHNAVLRPLYALRRDRHVDISILPVNARGILQMEELHSLFRPKTRAVVMTHASNVTGNVTDIKTASSIAHEHGALMITDTAQTAGEIPVDMQEMGIDILCFTGHKGLLGPQGTGGIIVRKGVQIDPLLRGGTGMQSFDEDMPECLPERLEAGTRNVPGIAGLSVSIEWLQAQDLHARHHREMALAKNFLLRIADIPGIRLYGEYDGPDERRIPIISLNIGDVPSGEIAELLWESGGISVRAGAHCAPLMHIAQGTKEQGVVRFSFCCHNTEEEVESAALLLRSIAQSLI